MNRLKLIGYITHHSNGIGFATAVFGSDGSNNFHAVQLVDEISGKNSRFAKLDTKSNEVTFVNSDIHANIDEDPIYVFIDKSENLHAGKIDIIKHELERFCEREPRQVSIIFQIKELIGTMEEKRISRKQFRNKIFDTAGIKAAQEFFVGSVLRCELWKIFINLAKDRQSAERILKSRSQISVKLETNNRISIDASVLDPADYGGCSLTEIEGMIQREFDETLKIENNEFDKINIDFDRLVELNQDLVMEVKLAGRQEERVAILLRSILEEFSMGILLVESISYDRGQFASKAIRDLKELTIMLRKSSSIERSKLDMMMEAFLHHLYKICFPMNRGAFLFYIAKHLSKHGNIAEMILRKLSNSRSVSVKSWEDDIVRVVHSHRIDYPKNYRPRLSVNLDLFS